MQSAETHGYIKTPRGPLYATLFQPEPAAREAVVLFEPFGEEKKCAFRMLVRLARALAERGLAVLRFDLSGTGESGGAHGEVIWEDWQGDAAAAVRFVRADLGIERWIAVGARLGALLAAQAAAAHGAQALSLVEPVLSGEECLRDLARRQKIKMMMTGAEAETDPDERWRQGERVDFGGFEVSPAMAEGLRREHLVERLPQLGTACRTQLLRVSGGSSFPSAWSELVQGVDEASIVRDKPFWGQLEYYESSQVIDAVLAFAASAAPAEPGRQEAMLS